MSRTLSNYMQNLIDKSTSDFHEALNPLIRNQMLQQQQEWEDKRKGGHIADLYKANTAELLGDDFFNNADNDRKLADNTRTFLNQQNINHSLNNPAQQKSVNEIFSELGGVDNILNDNFVGNHLNQNPLLKGYNNTQNTENQVFNINPASSINNFYKSDYADKLNGRLNKASNNINDTLKYSQDTQNDFWNNQYKMLNDLGVDYNNYAVNPIYSQNGVEDFRQNPLTKQQNRYAELAQNGNTIATEHIYNTMYPKMKLRERQYISPDGKTKVNEEIMYNIDPNGRYKEQVINKTNSPYLSQKDLEDYKYNKSLGLLKAKANLKGSGKEEHFRLTPNQFAEDTKHINDPVFKSSLAFVNENGTQADYNMLRQYNPNIKEVTDKWYNKIPYFSNDEEHKKYNDQLKRNQDIKNYFNMYHGGFDFIENPLNEEDKKQLDLLSYELKPTKKLNIYDIYFNGEKVFTGDLKTIREVIYS